MTKPESVDAAEGETAIFTCVGDGVPNPNYFWFINGVPITSNYINIIVLCKEFRVCINYVNKVLIFLCLIIA